MSLNAGNQLMTMETIRSLLDDQPIDVFCVSAENRRKQLLVCDMDSTIINGETLDDLANKFGVGEQVEKITEQAMRGELNYKDSLKARVALLKGHPIKAIQPVLKRMKRNRGAKALAKTMAKHGAHTALVTGGFTEFAERACEVTGFQTYFCNHLNRDTEKFDGTLREPIQGPEEKLEKLHNFAAENDLTAADAIAAGDGANDIPMLKAAGFGVAYKGKKILTEQMNLQINHTDLTSLLYLQGYHFDEFDR